MPGFEGLLQLDVLALAAMVRGYETEWGVRSYTKYGPERVSHSMQWLVRQGLVTRDGGAYQLVNRDQTIAWLRQHYPQTLPENLRA